jgi:hypothetical protein
MRFIVNLYYKISKTDEKSKTMRIPINPDGCSNNTRTVIPIFAGRLRPKKYRSEATIILNLKFK